MNRVAFATVLLSVLVTAACTDDVVYADDGNETGGDLSADYACFADDQSDGVMDWWLYTDAWAASLIGDPMPDLDPESELTGIACAEYVATTPEELADIETLPYWVQFSEGAMAPVWACSAACCSDRDCWGFQSSTANDLARCVVRDGYDGPAGLCRFPCNASEDCPPKSVCGTDGFCDWNFGG